MSEMTLEWIRDFHMENSQCDYDDEITASKVTHKRMSDCIDAHLAASKAQMLDVAAIRDVIAQMRSMSMSDGYLADAADKLDDALPKD